MLPASYGEALVYGEAISSVAAMERVRSMMGVCPQFDVLWGELSGLEHLAIYGNIKGVYWRDVDKQTKNLLEKVIPKISQQLTPLLTFNEDILSVHLSQK